MEQHELINKNCCVHYWIIPSGKHEWICFLHGAGADHRTFFKQVEALADRYNLLLMDGRGQGQSKMMAPIYAQMLAVNPMAREVVIPNAGHACNMENAAATNQAIKDFL